MFYKKISAFFIGCWVFCIFIPNAQAAKIYKTISYYIVSGTTAAQIDKSMAKNAPYLKSTGQHHLGVTTISFVTYLKLKSEGNYCKIDRIHVDILANMQLPRWKQRSRTKSLELAVVWDSLSQDIKRHEESHVVIARAHASEIEKKIRELSYQKNCDKLLQNIETIVGHALAQHDEAQKRFDRIEAKNFDKRFFNLLIRRLEEIPYQRK
ncbi:DUF922 domain-containing Zn-dependent protease [Bartonella tamiae]|uniref:Secreted Zn-dependent protease n=1 Tax=Bartonella tamiae Th239 TaxID=1094558 RepID=J1JV23_9HYPH|nr:DUF922 domain-containing protein [Bartonella tamiae]EJF88822.1 hypothetical protein ME5_01373 [Bartonella tamiae Th239]EJF94928.1 hypothetical protein MEG_00509 [Bartonella tamiae Th307]